MSTTNNLSHEIRWHRGFDCIRYECAHGSDRCSPGSGGSHGVHGLSIEFISLGPLGAVSFMLFTGWLPGQDRFGRSHGPQLAQITIHSAVDESDCEADRDYAAVDRCDILPTGKCRPMNRYIGAPQEAFLSLVNGGIDKLWGYLDGYYSHAFEDGDYPPIYDYPFAKRARRTPVERSKHSSTKRARP